MTFRINWETSNERQISMHSLSLPRTEGWREESMWTVHCESLNASKTREVRSQETGMQSKSSWLSHKTAENESLELKLEHTTPGRFCSFSHFGAGDDCLAIAGQHALQRPGLPQAKQGRKGRKVKAGLKRLQLRLWAWWNNWPLARRRILVGSRWESLLLTGGNCHTGAPSAL